MARPSVDSRKVDLSRGEEQEISFSLCFEIAAARSRGRQKGEGRDLH